MKEKCEDGLYDSAQDFVNDVALLFDNGDLYNKVIGLEISMLKWHRLSFWIYSSKYPWYLSG